MSVTLVVTSALHKELVDLAHQPLETAGVLLARPVHAPDGTIARLIATAFVESPADAYAERSDRALSITPAGYMSALRRAEHDDAIALWVHTHPGLGADPRPSRHDDAVDTALATTFRARTGAFVYGSFVASPTSAGFAFTGRIDDANTTAPIDRVFVAGARFRLLHAADSVQAPLPDFHDRNIRAFGPELVTVVSDLNIGIAGAGGHGSAVAEQLVRLGVRRLTLIDPKTISESNPTRVYGSTPDDVGRAKVDVLADHLERIAQDVLVTRVVGDLSQQDVARTLNTVDLVFCCTDDDAGRLRLSRFSYTHRTPVLDLGVILEADGHGTVNGIFGRVTVLHPGSACLLCRGRVDVKIAVAQERLPEEQGRLEAEGYAAALPGTEPAVVAFTSAVASAAVNELLERLVGYGQPEPPSEVLLLLHDRRISTSRRKPQQGHYCAPAAVITVGDQDPMWGLNWAS